MNAFGGGWRVQMGSFGPQIRNGIFRRLFNLMRSFSHTGVVSVAGRLSEMRGVFGHGPFALDFDSGGTAQRAIPANGGV